MLTVLTMTSVGSQDVGFFPFSPWKETCRLVSGNSLSRDEPEWEKGKFSPFAALFSVVLV